MKGYKLRIKTVEEPDIKMICCFLATKDYKESSPDSYLYKTAPVCWVGRRHYIESKLLQFDSLDLVIVHERATFRRNYWSLIFNLRQKGSRLQIAKMINVIETYIHDTVVDVSTSMDCLFKNSDRNI